MKSLLRLSLFLLLSIVFFNDCKIHNRNDIYSHSDNIRKNQNYSLFNDKTTQRKFYNALMRYEFQMDLIKNILDSNIDPNYCYGECGWIESNPLLLLSQLHFDTYYRTQRNESIPDPTPDIELFNLLIDKGANIDLYPYVYAIVYRKKIDFQMNEDEKNTYVEDSNRILKAFLDKGADPNAKGNHKAFDWQTYDDNLSYEGFQKMCKEPDATSPLYEAIKKGMLWESQVNLLLEYGAILDESCLEAAKLSGDKEMIDKITSLINNGE